MPSDGDCRDAQERRDPGDRKTLDFGPHDDSSTTWRQVVEGALHGRPDHICSFRVIALDRSAQDGRVTPAHRFLAPLISSNVDKYANKPCFRIVRSRRNGFGRSRSLEERLLNEIQRVVGTRDETSCEAIKALHMRLEQRGKVDPKAWSKQRRRQAARSYLSKRPTGSKCWC